MFFDDACVDFVEVETSLVGLKVCGAGRGEGGVFILLLLLFVWMNKTIL